MFTALRCHTIQLKIFAFDAALPYLARSDRASVVKPDTLPHFANARLMSSCCWLWQNDVTGCPIETNAFSFSVK